MSSDEKQEAPDYEALNNTFYSLVDSWLPKDFGKKGVQQKDADVLVKIRKAKEKERHRYAESLDIGLQLISLHSAANVENGDASTSNIPHAALLKRKLQSGSQTRPTGSNAPEAGKSDDDESGDESRTRSIAKKAKTGFDAFSKPGKSKSKGKQKDDGSGLTLKADAVTNAQKSTANGAGNDQSAPIYTNPFAMPSASIPSTSPRVDTPQASPPPPLTPSNDTTDSPNVVAAAADGLTKSQRKKQRKKEKKALAREESVKQQQLSMGKLAVAQ
jgi:hypothetical protein